MASNTRSRSSRQGSIPATVQWAAIAVVAILAVLAAFVFLGEGAPPGGGGHSGLAPVATAQG